MFAPSAHERARALRMAHSSNHMQARCDQGMGLTPERSADAEDHREVSALSSSNDLSFSVLVVRHARSAFEGANKC